MSPGLLLLPSSALNGWRLRAPACARIDSVWLVEFRQRIHNRGVAHDRAEHRFELRLDFT
jgi:hypothetical protein